MLTFVAFAAAINADRPVLGVIISIIGCRMNNVITSIGDAAASTNAQSLAVSKVCYFFAQRAAEIANCPMIGVVVIGFACEVMPSGITGEISATGAAFPGSRANCYMRLFIIMYIAVCASTPVMVFIERIVVPIEPFMPYFTAAKGLLAFSTYAGICTQGVVPVFVYITITLGARVPVIIFVPIILISREVMTGIGIRKVCAAYIACAIGIAVRVMLFFIINALRTNCTFLPVVGCIRCPMFFIYFVDEVVTRI